MSPGGEVREEMTSTEMPLGITGDVAFPHGPPIALHTGDVIVLLTDGIVEAVSSDRRVFGYDRAIDAVRRHRELPARGIVDALYQEVQEFAKGQPQRDDITALVVKVV
jgi:sigma-B regulation protein RsbU (phosphoserine phosphatase)